MDGTASGTAAALSPLPIGLGCPEHEKVKSYFVDSGFAART